MGRLRSVEWKVDGVALTILWVGVGTPAVLHRREWGTADDKSPSRVEEKSRGFKAKVMPQVPSSV
jgi:hypothetical protein